MCGIVGYIGHRQAAPVLLGGLKRLEYRGYDSYGIATLQESIAVHKKVGKVSDSSPDLQYLPGTIGIGHTRWATHGVPSDRNAHPHLDCKQSIALVHNGIIENYASLADGLKERGHLFTSDTDTEVVVHLLEEAYQGDLLLAMKQILPLIEGSYSFLAVAVGEEKIVAARCMSPLVIGIGDGEYFAASDITPLLEYTSRVLYLEDGDLAEITPGSCSVYHENHLVEREVHEIDLTPDTVQKGGYPHFMLKEIYEQPEVIHHALHSLTAETLPDSLRNAHSLTVVACGSSYHAGMIFRYLLESSCHIPVRLELGSEFKYMVTPFSDVILGITQSGETADTLAAIKRGTCNNIPTVAITNVLNSSVTRAADSTLLMYAGPEISVAATKSFIAQLGVLIRIVTLLCRQNCDEVLDQARYAVEKVLLLDLHAAVSLCRDAEHIFYVGRGFFYPVVMEGALKMKEISYIHAEAYAAGEIKHGPFSLLSPMTPVVAVCFPGSTYPVMMGNLKEMKARGTPIIAIGVEHDQELSEIVDVMVPLSEAHPYLQVIMATVVLQLLAYYTAASLGREIDMPRNLAKSVTVE